MSCMVPVNSTEASERDFEALLRRREEKMALTPFKLVRSELKMDQTGKLVTVPRNTCVFIPKLPG